MYLVDTHVLLWVLEDHPRLGPRTRLALQEAGVVHVSAISLLEIVVKSTTGRLTLPERLEEQVVEQGFTLLPFSAAHAMGVATLPGLDRHDPFDRALLAQALTDRLRFVTADRLLLGQIGRAHV